jgi:hypothetical protein
MRRVSLICKLLKRSEPISGNGRAVTDKQPALSRRQHVQNLEW